MADIAGHFTGTARWDRDRCGRLLCIGFHSAERWVESGMSRVMIVRLCDEQSGHAADMYIRNGEAQLCIHHSTMNHSDEPVSDLVVKIPHGIDPKPTFSLVRLMELYPDAIPTTVRQGEVMRRCTRITTLDLIEPLHQSDYNIARLGERKLLTDTDARATVELRLSARPQALRMRPTGRYSHPTFFFTQRSGLNSAASAPQMVSLRCMAKTL